MNWKAFIELLETLAAAALASLFILEGEGKLAVVPIAGLLIVLAVVLRLRSSPPAGEAESSPRSEVSASPAESVPATQGQPAPSS